jgi:hypothetical protein
MKKYTANNLNGTVADSTGQIVKKIEAGQVKINYTGLSVTNFVSSVVKTFDINVATPVVVGSPTTTYPNSTPTNYSGVFSASRGSSPTGRLIENPIIGQLHTWRIQYSYSNKASGSNGAFDLIFTNPVSGFQFIMSNTFPSGRTNGVLNSIAITVADNESIPSPKGYILQAMTSFTDTDLTIEILSITRISNAIEL